MGGAVAASAIARRPQQHMRAVAVAPPGGLLLTWPEPSSLQLSTWWLDGGYVAATAQRFHLLTRDLQLGMRTHHAHMPQRGRRQRRKSPAVKWSLGNRSQLLAQPPY